MRKLIELDFVGKEKVYVKRSERVSRGNASSEVGNQIKWKSGNKFVKLDCLGYEGIAERMVAWLLSFSNIPRNEWLPYYTCEIYEDNTYLGSGCYSYNYITEGYSEISFRDILQLNMVSLGSNYDTVRDTVLDSTGLDPKRYIDLKLCLDSITKNDDRHFANMSILTDGTNYRFTPIFDNGSSCLSGLVTYPMGCDLEGSINSLLARPFNVDFKRQIGFVERIGIDYKSWVTSMELKSDNAIRARDVIMYGLNGMRYISWVEL